MQAFKKGPDYIDPMWLSRASGRPCYNLDFNTQSHDEIQSMFASKMPAGGLGLIEGNKGLFDGLDVEGSDCSAALAKLLKAPVILVIDVVGITRGIVPLIMGYETFDSDVQLAGVILNRVASPRQERKLRQALELYTSIPVLGAIARDKSLAVTERHLGLTTPDEIAAVDVKIERLQQAVSNGVDRDAVVGAARTSGPHSFKIRDTGAAQAQDVVIAVARDSAFNFYYPDDLETLQKTGAKLEFFSPISDGTLPQCDGILIGGGFPETHMRALEANAEMRTQVRDAVLSERPIYAECGGLMYLSRSIAWKGKTCAMAGVIPGRVEMNSRPQGRGLMVLQETGSCAWSATASCFPAHEFHYASLVDLEPGTQFAWNVKRGNGINGQNDGIVLGNVTAGFCHQRNTSRNRWAERFVGFVRERKKALAGVG